MNKHVTLIIVWVVITVFVLNLMSVVVHEYVHWIQLELDPHVAPIKMEFNFHRLFNSSSLFSLDILAKDNNACSLALACVSYRNVYKNITKEKIEYYRSDEYKLNMELQAYSIQIIFYFVSMYLLYKILYKLLFKKPKAKVNNHPHSTSMSNRASNLDE